MLLLLNPDAIPAPGCFEALRNPPKSYAAWMGVVTLPGRERVNSAGGESHFLGFSWVGGLNDPVSALPQEPYRPGFVSGARLAVRLDVWRELGGFPDHFFLYFDDVDLSHRLRLAGRDFGSVPTALVEHDYVFDKGPRNGALNPPTQPLGDGRPHLSGAAARACRPGARRPARSAYSAWLSPAAGRGPSCSLA